MRHLEKVAFFSLAVMMGMVLSVQNPLRAQDAAGRIVGNVTDPNGGTVSDARVTVTNVATQVSQEATVDQDGYYQTSSLPIGTYRVTIERSDFRRAVFDNQVLHINQVLRVDAKLELGEITQSIEVTSKADTVETVNPTLGASVTGRTLTDMPLNGRNVLDLALLQPGVTPSNPDDSSAGT